VHQIASCSLQRTVDSQHSLMGLVCKQVFGDPDAADIVFTCGADILAVGLNVTHQVVLTGNSNALVSLLLRMSSASGCSG
jgi:hypothetical protein